MYSDFLTLDNNYTEHWSSRNHSNDTLGS
jgi:hypothetical protein